MSDCIKDLYDYDLVKKGSKCGIVTFKSNFHKRTLSKDGLFQHCEPCPKIFKKIYKKEHYDLEINRRKNIDSKVWIKIKNIIPSIEIK